MYKDAADRVAWNKRANAANPKKRAGIQRKAYLKMAYGLTPAQWDAILANQAGGCALCGVTDMPTQKRFALDHDHKTGKIRALLCDLCNQGLGCFKENPELLRRAAIYLETDGKVR